MSKGLNNLNNRLNYRGGATQEGRFQLDKLKSLRKALLYSYQAATAVLEDGRLFRCLINSDRVKADYDCKILSIPYEDICLGYERVDLSTGEIYYELKKPNGKTSNGIETIGIKPGDVFKWKETNTYWIVYLQHLEEDSYFRSEIYKCESEVQINNNKYHIYVRGPVETTIQWNQKAKTSWNDMNYSMIIYITKNEETLDYFSRFKTITIDGNEWEVAAVNPYSADGIIKVALGEWYNNEFKDNSNEIIDPPIDINPSLPYIDGPSSIHVFDKVQYSIVGTNSGKWSISDCKKAKIICLSENKVTIQVITGKSCNLILTYTTDTDKIDFPIVVKSV